MFYRCRVCTRSFDLCECKKEAKMPRIGYATVQLQGKSDLIELQVEYAKLQGANILVYGGRYYVYGGMDSHLRMRFNETNPPVTVP